MLQIIRKGDKTTHGGSVLTASETMKFGGIGVARKGDKVSCPVEGHGPTTIVEGN
ncbi:PAAR domain-containing protein, partial [Klebsiella pneumoniae]|nr:PAAR domain-containing protein [Klebsiella pneumoniae]